MSEPTVAVPGRSRPGAAWRTCWTVGLVAASALVLGRFVWRPGLNAAPHVPFARMVEGTAVRPFVQRALMPLSIRALRSLAPAGARAWMSRQVEDSRPLAALFRLFRWEKEYALEFAIAMALMYAAVIGYGIALRWLSLGLFPEAVRFADVVSLLGVLVLPAMYMYVSLIYDIPVAFLFTLGLALMQRRRWAAFLFIYGVACLNKETTILLTLVFAIYYFSRERMDRRLFVRLLAVQAILFVTIIAVLAVAYRDNPGQMLRFMLLKRNVNALMSPSPRVLSYACVIFLSAWRLSDKPLFLRRAIWVLPPLLGLQLIFGIVFERRVYFEALPVILLLMSHTVATTFGVKLAVAPPPVPAEPHSKRKGDR